MLNTTEDILKIFKTIEVNVDQQLFGYKHSSKYLVSKWWQNVSFWV